MLRNSTLPTRRKGKPRPGRATAVELKKLREACFDRDEAKCQECGRLVLFYAESYLSISYHMAHIKAKRMGGDSLDNVRTLCGDCHRAEHNYGKGNDKPCPPKVRP